MLLAGTEAHRPWLLTHKARQVRSLSFDRGCTASHQADLGAVPLRCLKVQSAGGLIHLPLKGFDRLAHSRSTHHRAEWRQCAQLAAQSTAHKRPFALTAGRRARISRTAEAERLGESEREKYHDHLILTEP